MHTYRMKYQLSQKYRVVARTTPEIYYNIRELTARLAARDSIQFQGRKMGIEAAINAIVINWLTLPEAEQLAVLREGVAAYERVLEGAAEPPGAKKSGPKAAPVPQDDDIRPEGFSGPPGRQPPGVRPGGKAPRKRDPRVG